MNNYFLGILLITVIGFSSCDNQEGSGTLDMKYQATINNTPLQFNHYYDMGGDSVKFEVVKFYVSGVTIQDKDATETIEINEVSLIDFESGPSVSVSTELDAGAYKNPSYSVGLSDALNGTDPSTYASEHPLSTAQNNYWSMANSYVYFKIEGFRKNGGVEAPFVYHVGGNGMYSDKEVIKAFTINGGNVTTVLSTLDMNAIFANVDFATESETHTGNNLPLANKMLANFVASLTIN